MDSFTAKAPARANIIGEHTDYATNGGHVLPTPLPFYTTVTLEKAAGPAGSVTIASGLVDEPPCERLLTEPRRGHWSDYVVGALRAAAAKTELPSLAVSIESDVPIGCGISSSAALCVATVRAAKGLTNSRWSDEEVALMAYEAEHDYVGVPCGKMDQFASSVGRPGQALLLNTKTLEHRNVKLPPDIVLMLVDCGKKHDLAKGSGYRQRVAECTQARNALGVDTLCELGTQDLPRLAALPDTITRRARHVITENLRVLAFVEALERGDVKKQAELIAASHVSQRDDFECSIPEIDALVASSIRFGVTGARLVGGGFGGSIIALVPRRKAAPWWTAVANENHNATLISTYAMDEAGDASSAA